MITVQDTDSIFRVQHTLCSYNQITVYNTIGIFCTQCTTHYMRLACNYCHSDANTILLLFPVLDLRYDSELLWYGHLYKLEMDINCCIA